jgi:hypothetical protein
MGSPLTPAGAEGIRTSGPIFYFIAGRGAKRLTSLGFIGGRTSA